MQGIDNRNEVWVGDIQFLIARSIIQLRFGEPKNDAELEAGDWRARELMYSDGASCIRT